MSAAIRAAQPTDVRTYRRLAVAAWQAAYRGVMPDACLEGPDPAERAATWRRFLESDPPDRHLDVVLVAADDVAGFASYGPANDRSAVRRLQGFQSVESTFRPYVATQQSLCPDTRASTGYFADVIFGAQKTRSMP